MTDNGKVIFENCTIKGNHAYDGAVLHLMNSNQTNLISNSSITKNGLYYSDMFTSASFIT